METDILATVESGEKLMESELQRGLMKKSGKKHAVNFEDSENVQGDLTLEKELSFRSVKEYDF